MGTPVTRRLQSADGAVMLAAHDYGGSGPSCLLLHGNGLHGRAYACLVRHLTAAGLRVVALDHRGCGASTLPEEGADLQWMRFAEDALAVQDALAMRPCLGFGHSLGGAALLLAEASRPGSFRALYLFEPVVAPPATDAATHPWDAPLAPKVQAALRRRRTFASRQAALELYASKPPLSFLHPECLRDYVQHGFRDLPDGSVELCCKPETESAIFAHGPRAGAEERLPLVSCPVTVAMGGRDAADGPARVAPVVASGVQHGRLETHAELGHFGPLEAPAAVAQAALRVFAPLLLLSRCSGVDAGLREINVCLRSRSAQAAFWPGTMVWRELRSASRVLKWYEWFPFVNLIYDFLYDKEPSVGAVKDIMNAQGLVCALLLGVVMAMPSSVTFEELTAANLRYVEVPALHDFYHMSRDLPLDPVLAVKYGPNTFSNRLVYMIAGASGALTSGLLSIVLTYFFISAADFHNGRQSFKVWWDVVKYLCLQQLVSTAVGVVLTFLSVAVLMDIKFPDGDCPDKTPTLPLKVICSHTYYFRTTLIVLWSTLVGALTLLSIAATRRYYSDHLVINQPTHTVQALTEDKEKLFALITMWAAEAQERHRAHRTPEELAAAEA